MKLSEVMKESKIKIHASINGHGILLITKAEIGVRDGLLVDSLTYFDEDLIFREPSKIIAVNKRDGRSYEYESQSIGPVETRYGKYHLIRCSDEGKTIDRRRAERYDIDRLGVIRINKGGDIRNALVYDISMKGIAFILDSDAVCKVGDHISASFRYDPAYFHFYACEATVVRVFMIDHQIAVGCTLDSMGADLITLISNKKKEKAGIPVEDFLGISSSPDSDIASGDKIPVNYVPPLHMPEILDEDRRPKYEYTEDIVEKKPTSRASRKADHEIADNSSHQEDTKYLSPDEAADLIPERSETQIREARAKLAADLIPGEVLANESDDKFVERIVDLEDLEELQTIEDRTPLKRAAAKAPSARVPGANPAKSLANAANAANSTVHLPKNKQTISDSVNSQKAPLPGDFPPDYDGYFNQNGYAVDEKLFSKNKRDGFLTPEQIADIIGLERISKKDF